MKALFCQSILQVPIETNGVDSRFTSRCQSVNLLANRLASQRHPDAELREMNKPPQPITGPTSVPLPSPSPGLTQATYASGQPTSLVFATQTPQQMNSAPQPRQFATGPRALHQQGGYRALQPYYANRPTSVTRVQTSSGPRPVGPTHIYQPGSQMMMIPGQQLSFAGSPQGYFIPPGQYRAPYMPPSPQYPVTSGTAGFYPGTSPAEYPTYEPSLAARERRGGGRENGRLSLHGAPLTSQRYPAGAYYPAQPQYSHTPPVQTATVISPAQPQQQALPPQPPTHPPAPKRERVTIRIRDPNQGGRDITEEIMSGGRSTSTPPSQSSTTEEEGPAQTNGEFTKPVTIVTRTDENAEPADCTVTAAETLPPVLSTPEPTTAAVPLEARQETDGQVAPLTEQVVSESHAPVAGMRPEVPIPQREEQAPAFSPLTASTSPPPEEVQTPPPATTMAQASHTVGAGMTPAVKAVTPEGPSTQVEPLAAPASVEKPLAQVAEEVVVVVVEEKVEKVKKEPAVTINPEVVVAVVVIKEDTKPAPRPVTPIATGDDFVPSLKLVAAVEAATKTESVVLPPAPKQKAMTEPISAPAHAATPPVSLAEPAVAQKKVEQLPLSNGLPQEDPDEVDAPVVAIERIATVITEPAAPPPQETANPAAAAVEEEERKEEEQKEEDASPVPLSSSPSEDSSMQAAVSVPKKKRNMKELNKKEAIGDMLDAFKEEEVAAPATEPSSSPPEPSPVAPTSLPPADAPDETWEEKEDKQNADTPPLKPGDLKYQYKGEQWKPIDPEEKKRYDREFLLGCQFISASMNKPEGLPLITDVVLDKANKTPMRPAEPGRNMNAGPDFTPAFMGNLGRQSSGGGGPRAPGRDHMGPPGPRRSQQGQRKEPRKIITISSSLGGEVELNKAEKAWKPTVKKAVTRGRGAAPEDEESDDPEQAKTQELFKRVRSILNKLTPQMFQQLMKQVTELTIDTEERLKGVIDLIFEKAISEPNFSVAYANMCRCLMGLKVPTTDKPGVTVNFRKLLLNRCQKEFEKDQDDDVIFEAKQKEMEAAKEEEKAGLKATLEEAKDQARRRSLGNIKFIGELFKLKMLTEAIMHDCIVKLLKNHDEESLECLCRLLSTIGKDLDFEKAKPRMDQYFAQMDKIIKEKKTSSRIRFMLQDVIDLRRSGWVPRRGEQGPKTIDQIHKDAEQEEHMQQVKVQQQLMSRNDGGGRGGGGGGRDGRGGDRGGRDQVGRGGQQVGRGSQPQDEGWNTVPISTKNRPIDTSRLSKITKPGALDFSNQLLAPQLGGKGMWGSWGKGSSGGTTGAKPATGAEPAETGRPATGNRFSALQQSAPPASSSDADRRVPQRSSSSRDRDRFDRFERHDSSRDERCGSRDTRPPITKRSFSRETEERRGDSCTPTEPPVRRVASMTDDRDRGGSRSRGGSGSRDRAPSKEVVVKRETAPTPPPDAPTKPAMTEEELEKKSSAIIEEYLHLNDMKEALQCVVELNSAPLLFVFVRNGLENTLERSAIARERMGLLLHQLIKAGTLPTTEYYKGLQEILEVAEDMAIDIPHIWQYLSELINPMLHEGGIPMGQLFREVSKPLIPLRKAGVLLVHILNLLCKEMTHKKVGGMWMEAGLNWRDFLPEDEDVNKFVTEQKIEFTLGEKSDGTNQKTTMSGEELSKQLDRLIQDKANNQRIRDWVQANLDEQQTSANQFVRSLMTSICQSAVICENPYKVDVEQITQRAKLLQRYLSDEKKELQALYALQALMVHMEQPANLLRMFFDTLYDEDVIKEEAFYRWESSKDPAEQTGKGVALKSVTAFFTWLRDAEEESDKD
ncbi:eukaryotic translation initiation factor 4 gamma 1 isoform X3 [Oncorhynchus mykiss]|uniref:eukaryotic translation initiation factor 4 gamma 1 isoform X3 n=2 Tax=Oncorhynchus mykiss TaxID=8022 RepID=UPI001877581C|nr:eukaryotic translation initiation factor 4 gamma 1 isoform X3 [Oncorhynchus mykiss]